MLEFAPLSPPCWSTSAGGGDTRQSVTSYKMLVPFLEASACSSSILWLHLTWNPPPPPPQVCFSLESCPGFQEASAFHVWQLLSLSQSSGDTSHNKRMSEFACSRQGARPGSPPASSINKCWARWT